MTIFITGSTGYIGNMLALKLANSGHIVHALVRNPAEAKQLVHANIRLFTGDLSDIESIKKGMKGCERVFHLAAFARLWARPSDIFYKVNVDGTRNILQAALEEKVSKLVYTSSTAVFGNSINEPLSENDPRTIGFSSDYDLSKCMAEKLVLEYVARGLDAVIVNPSRVYGPGMETYSNTFTRLIKASLDGRLIPVPNCPEVVANYCYVNDVVEGHLLAMEHGRTGERYILGGENISYRELFRVVRETIPGRTIIKLPKILLKLAGAMQLIRFYLTKKQPAFTPAAISRYYNNSAFDCQKAITQLNYRITPFDKAMAETIDQLKRMRNEND